MAKISDKTISEAHPYKTYLLLAQKLFEKGKTTSDDPHYNEPWVLELTKLNFQRISRLEKTTVINPLLEEQIKKIKTRQLWIILGESWCGDVAQNVPVLQKMAELSEGKIEIKILLRDKNLETMDNYLTNGGRAIPKLIAINLETGEEIFTWGPRPAPVQALMLENKRLGKSFEEGHQIIHGWYAKDKSQTLQNEFYELLKLG